MLRSLTLTGLRLCVFLIAGYFALSSNRAHAALVTFNITSPENIRLTWDDFEIFDDWVRFTSGSQTPVTAKAGDTIAWDYDFGTSFKVNSSDLADLPVLRLFGDFGDITEYSRVDVKFWLSDPDHKPISQTVNTFSGMKWDAGKDLVLYEVPSPSGNDKLGNLEGFTVADFHIEVKVNEGQVNFRGGRLQWEAGDITALPEPSSVVFLVVGLTAFGYRSVRRTKGGDTRTRRVAC